MIEIASAFGDSPALIERLTQDCHILETGNDSFRFQGQFKRGTQNRKKQKPEHDCRPEAGLEGGRVSVGSIPGRPQRRAASAKGRHRLDASGERPQDPPQNGRPERFLSRLTGCGKRRLLRADWRDSMPE
ncbi:hypothetical protein [Pararhizobium capsulatum]|uniref:hypothetical protein n=1 Tax=Pararhizobium capsulatum TaxID=34014 RepID=UPI0035220991